MGAPSALGHGHEGDLPRPDHAHASGQLLHVLGVADLLDLVLELGPLGLQLGDPGLEAVDLVTLSEEVPDRTRRRYGQDQDDGGQDDRAGRDPAPRRGLGPGAQDENLRYGARPAVARGMAVPTPP